MAKTSDVKMTTDERRRRRFSPSFKEKKVREIEQKQTTISQVCRQYQVAAITVYRWISAYGDSYQKESRMIVELESDTRVILEQRKRIAELERIIGQKQVQLDFTEKMIELAEETYGVDIKKKFNSGPLSGTGKTKGK